LGGSQPVTAEQALAARQDFERLVAEGPGAIPAMAEFLQKNQDAAFGEAGAKTAGAASVRAGLLDVLRQIGGPGALEASHEVLKAPSNPLDVALAARNLEEGAPGTYQRETIDAARQMLDQIAEGKVDSKDTGPLFQVLQAYGDASVAEDLEKLVPKWSYYATIALANLPEGEGIPSLVRIAQEPVSTGQTKFALQMLAQVSVQYPAANSALLQMAGQNQIPDDAWRVIAEGLAGNQYGFERRLPDNSFPPQSNRMQGSSDLGPANQTFFSKALPKDSSAAEIALRAGVIDQLLAATSNPASRDVLTQARRRLPGGGPGD
jgi:hypothetical protein